MGCICSKGGRANNFLDNNVRRKEKNKAAKRLVSLSRKDEVVVEVDGSANDATASLISNQPGNDNVEYAPVSSDEGGKKEIIEKANNRMSSSIVSMSNGERGAQVVAGWPSWLTAVAGEAIIGWVPRRADSFEKLDKIGQGTYSSVYKARDLETNKIVALKKVRFANMDPESVRFMAREIIVLRRLDHPNVMKLEGVIASRMSGSLYLVFEYMEHDLAGLLASPGIKFTEAQIKCYMQQLLHGLEHCHNRGVLHRDIKGSNLLIDTNGNLKIADFGLATFFLFTSEAASNKSGSYIVVQASRAFAWCHRLWSCCGSMERWLHSCRIVCWEAYHAWKNRGGATAQNLQTLWVSF